MVFSRKYVNTFNWTELDGKVFKITVVRGYVFGWDGFTRYLLKEPEKKPKKVRSRGTTPRPGTRGYKKFK